MNSSGTSIADRSRVRPNGRSFAQRIQSIEHDRRSRRHSHQVGCRLPKARAVVRRALCEGRVETRPECLDGSFGAIVQLAIQPVSRGQCATGRMKGATMLLKLGDRALLTRDRALPTRDRALLTRDRARLARRQALLTRCQALLAMRRSARRRSRIATAPAGGFIRPV
jgi:hypothetical protein